MRYFWFLRIFTFGRLQYRYKQWFQISKMFYYKLRNGNLDKSVILYLVLT